MRKFPEVSSYWSDDEGRQVVEAWRRSGENATAFARRHGLRAKRLVYWREKFERNENVSVAAVAFAPAVVVAPEEVAATASTPPVEDRRMPSS